MKNVDEFYESIKKINKPAPLLRGFFDMNLDKDLKEKIAIDLGAGTGNDTKFLIEKGFKVTCIDKEEKLKYFEDFKIIYYAEKKFFKDTVIEKNKYYHVFEIYAKKK